MLTLKELLEVGLGLGYKEQELREFVKREQEEERVQRLRQREVEKKEEEIKMRRGEAEHRQAMEMVELQHQRELELAAASRDNKEGVAKEWTDRVKGPKLPCFDQDKDNMDSYLARFEHYAEAHKWSRDQWSLHLSALLKGKALDVHSRLPTADSSDYDKLKAALLKRFELTEDGFRKWFKAAKPEKGESFVQFMRRLCN